MKKISILAAVLLSATLFPAFTQARAASSTFEGVISDSMCGKKHMLPGKTDAECTKECVKAGAKYVLVVGDKIYTLNAKPATIEPFAGKHVRVSGDVHGTTIMVAAIGDAK